MSEKSQKQQQQQNNNTVSQVQHYFDEYYEPVITEIKSNLTAETAHHFWSCRKINGAFGATLSPLEAQIISGTWSTDFKNLFFVINGAINKNALNAYLEEMYVLYGQKTDIARQVEWPKGFKDRFTISILSHLVGQPGLKEYAKLFKWLLKNQVGVIESMHNLKDAFLIPVRGKLSSGIRWLLF